MGNEKFKNFSKVTISTSGNGGGFLLFYFTSIAYIFTSFQYSRSLFESIARTRFHSLIPELAAGCKLSALEMCKIRIFRLHRLHRLPCTTRAGAWGDGDDAEIVRRGGGGWKLLKIARNSRVHRAAAAAAAAAKTN